GGDPERFARRYRMEIDVACQPLETGVAVDVPGPLQELRPRTGNGIAIVWLAITTETGKRQIV
ncbi:MAG: hypothetical protein ACKO9F_02325, partial [Caldilinea sp.]